MRSFIVVGLLLVTSYAFSQTDGFAENQDGTSTYYRIFGSGKPLLIINGGPGMNSNGFETPARFFAKSHQVIIYDQRGTGRSRLNKLDSTTVSMDLMIGDMESLRKHLKLERWSILGHSFGGILASYYTVHYPDRVESIVFSSSGGIDLGLMAYAAETINSRLSEDEREKLAYWNKKMSEGDTSYHTKLERGKLLAPAYVYDRKFIPVLAERLTQGNSRINGLIWRDLQRIKFDCKPALRSFKKPVLIIQGKQDIIKEETAMVAHEILQNSKVIFLDHSCHYGWLDNPSDYYREVNSFLDTM